MSFPAVFSGGERSGEIIGFTCANYVLNHKSCASWRGFCASMTAGVDGVGFG
jgi:hypothetical protein